MSRQVVGGRQKMANSKVEPPRPLRSSSWLLLGLFMGCGSCLAADPARLNERVLIVYNKAVSDSVAVAKHYADRRGIPVANRCAINPGSADAVAWKDFDPAIKAPIRKCLRAVGTDKILYIVFTYQTPYRLTDLPGGPYALDQFVADIWDRYGPPDPDPAFRRAQPYFAEAETQGNVYREFISFADYRDRAAGPRIYNVWRLDGASVALAEGLVDKALAAERSGLSGQACLDRRFGNISGVLDSGYGAGDWDLHAAADFSRRAGFAVTEDNNEAEFGTAPAPLCHDAALYSGWYKLNHYNDAFTWKTGAIGFHLDSLGAADPRGGESWSANAILMGITVTSGAVSEPYLEGMAHPDGVFRNLFEGANVGDAFLRNMRWLKWKILNLGDPLYRPFPEGLPPFHPPVHTESSLFLASLEVPGGTPTAAIVTLADPAPAGGTVVNLKSSDPRLVTIPDSVIVKQGLSSASFPIWTLGVTKQTPVVISASGGMTRSNTLTLLPLVGRIGALSH